MEACIWLHKKNFDFKICVQKFVINNIPFSKNARKTLIIFAACIFKKNPAIYNDFPEQLLILASGNIIRYTVSLQYEYWYTIVYSCKIFFLL